MIRFRNTIVVIMLLCSISLRSQHINETDSLFFLLKGSKDTAKVNIYNSLSWAYRNSNLAFTDSFAELAADYAAKINYDKGLGLAYVNKGYVAKNSGDYSSALKLYRWALINFVRSGYEPGYASVYNNVASVYYLQGSYSKALFYYFHALKISEKLSDNKMMAKSLNNIGAVYMEQNQFDKAVYYFNKAYNILRTCDENEAADCLNNIGTVYQYKGDTAKALANYVHSMEINSKLGDRKDVSAVLNNIGYMYFERGNYKLALDHYHQSLQIDEDLGDVRAKTASFGNITNCYIKLKMFHAAQNYVENMLNVALEYNIRSYIVDAYALLDSIAENTGNYKDALAYHKLYKAYSDSIFNDESKNDQQQLESLYLKEKAEKELLISSKEGEMSIFKAKEKDKEVSHYILLIGMILSLFLLAIYVVFFLIRRNKYS